MTADDCPSPGDDCLPVLPNRQKACWFNLCANPGSPPLASTAWVERQKYFAPCETSSGTGTCLPYVTYDQSGAAIEVGLCVQAGRSTGPCDLAATRPNWDQLCPVGQLCDPVAPAGTATCKPVCNAAPSEAPPVPAVTCSGAEAVCTGVSTEYGASYLGGARLGLCD